MRIGGFVPLSLVDFPGKVAASVFLQGCDFRCPFCHNHSLLGKLPPSGRLIPQEMVLEALARRGRMLDAVVVTGGEPLLQPGLPAFLARIRSLGLLVKLDTNGNHPDRLRRLIGKGALDFIAMDVKAPRGRYEALAGRQVREEAIWESIRLIAGSGVPHEFRTTNVGTLLSDADLEEIRGLIPPGSPHRVNPFIKERALDPALRGWTPSTPRAGPPP